MAFNKAKALQEAEKTVAQGKIAQAIKLYQHVLEKDPSDLLLLNTLGDLYLRDKNIAEALNQFYKLAESYVREGFTVKAIAIYKKISKIDINNHEPLTKMAELYQAQGLGREAREQYVTAFEFFQKKGKSDVAAEMLRKVIQLDPENVAALLKLAEFTEKVGERQQAADEYLEAGELALRQGDVGHAEGALSKAAALGQKKPKLRLLRAQMALKRKAPAEAEKLIAGHEELKDDPAAKRLLLEAYLAGQKLEKAQGLLLDVFRARPDDFSPIAAYASACARNGAYDAALAPLRAVADEMLARHNTAPLMESLRQLWSKAAHPISILELAAQIAEKTGDELNLPELREALGHAFVEAGQLDKAEECFRKLVNADPDNANYADLLKQVLQKQGKEFVPASPSALSEQGLALEPEAAEAEPAEVITDPKEAAMVNEAIENSDLFAKYNLTEKAVGELEKVLAVYPRQVEIHKRIFELCQKNMHKRGMQAAKVLARIYSERGNHALVERYQEAARQLASGDEAVSPATVSPSGSAVAPLSPVAAEEEALTEREQAASPPEIDLSQEFSFEPAAERAPTGPQEIPSGMASPTEQSAPLPPSPTPEPPPPAPLDVEPAGQKVAGFDYEEASQEIEFYLQQGFQDEAQKIVRDLEAKCPGDPRVAELVQRVESFAPSPLAEPAEPKGREPGTIETTGSTDLEEIEPAMPDDRGGAARPQPPQSVPAPPPEPPRQGPVAAEPASAGPRMLEGLAGDLASSLEGAEAPSTFPASPTISTRVPAPAASPNGSSQMADLSGLLDELGEGEKAEATADDAETHYNLGIAFREMGLLDEAIGEFQKVVRGAQKGEFPAHYLQSCTLLAASFTDKGMPAIAAKWLTRALETTDLDEEATLAVLYDLGSAYEQAGDSRTALEKFTEVYSQNIDYRDVAEKIRTLQQKVS